MFTGGPGYLQEGLSIYRRAWVFTGRPEYLQEGLGVYRRACMFTRGLGCLKGFCLTICTFKMYHIKMWQFPISSSSAIMPWYMYG